MTRFLGIVALALILCVAYAPLASANSITYTYTGQPFNTFVGGDSCIGGVGECSLSVTFTLSSALGANLVSVTVTPPTYRFFDGVNTLNQTNSTIVNFNFSTNATGQIIAWHATVTDPTYYSPSDPLNMGTGFTGPGNGQDSTNDNPVGKYSAYQLATFPGTWTAQPAQTPEPSALLLLGSGLLGVLGAARSATPKLQVHGGSSCPSN